MVAYTNSSLHQPVAPNTTNPSQGPIVGLPNELVMKIFLKLNTNNQNAVANVCTTFRGVINDPYFQRQLIPKDYIFGKDMWEKYFGDVGDVAPLPSDIYKILMSPCSFNPGKKVHETHLLTLIPKTVNGKPFTLNSLGELVKEPKEGNATRYRSFQYEIKNEHGDTPIKESYWVLFTKDVIPNSRHLTYESQEKLVKELSAKANVPYAVPGLLDAATSIFIECIRSGTRLYSDEPWTCTMIKQRVSKYPNWPLGVGGFAPMSGPSSGGLCVRNYVVGDFERYGVGGARKFRAIGT